MAALIYFNGCGFAIHYLTSAAATRLITMDAKERALRNVQWRLLELKRYGYNEPAWKFILLRHVMATGYISQQYKKLLKWLENRIMNFLDVDAYNSRYPKLFKELKNSWNSPILHTADLIDKSTIHRCELILKVIKPLLNYLKLEMRDDSAIAARYAAYQKDFIEETAKYQINEPRYYKKLIEKQAAATETELKNKIIEELIAANSPGVKYTLLKKEIAAKEAEIIKMLSKEKKDKTDIRCMNRNNNWNQRRNRNANRNENRRRRKRARKHKDSLDTIVLERLSEEVRNDIRSYYEANA